MNREEFHAKLAGRDTDELAKILWTLSHLVVDDVREFAALARSGA